jgi:hypothetical protein
MEKKVAKFILRNIALEAKTLLEIGVAFRDSQNLDVSLCLGNNVI